MLTDSQVERLYIRYTALLPEHGKGQFLQFFDHEIRRASNCIQKSCMWKWLMAHRITGLHFNYGIAGRFFIQWLQANC